jgi:starch phosphorylase
VPSYKRLTLMLRDPERLSSLLLDPSGPCSWSSPARRTPADDGGKELVQHIVRFADQHDVRHRIVFLPDYDIGMARYLYGGCDVWLNNPLRPLEACGTSGMKSALNGGLNLSIRDGWWDEMYDGENGWAIPTADGVEDPDRRDDLEAQAFYELVEKQVRTRFYDHDDRACRSAGSTWSGTPCRPRARRCWPAACCATTCTSSTPRPPALARAVGVGVLARRGPRRLALARRRRVGAACGSCTSTRSARATPPRSAPRSRSARWSTSAGCSPSDVAVQAVYGRVDEADELRAPSYRALQDAGDGDDGLRRFEGSVPLERAGSFGYSVRVLPHADVAAERRRLGLMAAAT